MSTLTTTCLLGWLSAQPLLAAEATETLKRLSVIGMTDGTRLVIVAVIVAALIIAILFTIATRRPRQSGPYHFPERQCPQRLGAPYAGGNQVSRDLGPPLP